jgi:hypothetical protein
MVMAVGLVLGADAARSIRGQLQPLLIVLVLAGCMLANLQVDASYEAAVEQSRGLSRFSDAIYRLAGWLEARPGANVYAVDWGISKNVQVLTRGRVNPIDISGYAGESEDEFTRRATEALADPAALYIFHSREDTVYERYAWFQATAERMDVRIKIIDATRDKSGAPVHVIWARQ